MVEIWLKDCSTKRPAWSACSRDWRKRLKTRRKNWLLRRRGTGGAGKRESWSSEKTRISPMAREGSCGAIPGCEGPSMAKSSTSLCAGRKLGKKEVEPGERVLGWDGGRKSSWVEKQILRGVAVTDLKEGKWQRYRRLGWRGAELSC